MNKSLKDMTIEEIEIEFDKLEDENLCLKIDIEEKDDVIAWYREDAENRAGMHRRLS